MMAAKEDIAKGCLKEGVDLNLRKFVFGNRVVDYWNGLSDSCVNCSTINNFKSKTRKCGNYSDVLPLKAARCDSINSEGG